ncbi:MAG: 2-oxoacid:acceptor oxidoreductase subunit alpha [Symbiobacteriia bacterium]
MMDLVNWKIGGQQGEGIDSTGDILATACNRLGYYIYGYKLFSSRIKGGHTNYKIRIATKRVLSTSDDLQILVALDQESIDLETQELVPGGLVIADTAFKPQLPEGSKAALLPVPFTEMAKELGNLQVRNVISLGVTAFLLGLPLQPFNDLVMEKFGKRKGMGEVNVAALKAGYEYAESLFGVYQDFHLSAGDGKARLLLIGNEAAALGALAAGCRLMTAYPITPATEVMQYLIPTFPEFGGIVVQCEDEIASITAAIGAGFAGARSLTATSGPGLSLMQEGIGLASMAEIPVVIINTQRGGPSTGMPTKQEQSDVFAMIFGGHGDSPRIVLTPATTEEAFYDTALAFNLAERFQCPVLVATDLSISLNLTTVDNLDLSQVKIDRGEVVDSGELLKLGRDAFKRYSFTENNISPRSVPGQKYGQYLATGIEHSETGKVFESPVNRFKQMNKRFDKLKGIDVPGIHYSGDKNPDILLVGFGSTIGAIDGVMEQLRAQGKTVGHAHIHVMWPFPVAEVKSVIESAKNVVVVENNLQGQLARLIKMEVGHYSHVQSLLKYDGTPFLPSDIMNKCREVLA